MEKFDVVLADPPWQYYGSMTKMGAAGKHYATMSMEELTAMRDSVRAVLNTRAVVFMWTTSSMLKNSIQLLEDWGLYYRGVSFVWVKTRKDGQIVGAQGVRASITKPTTEFVIAACTHRAGRPHPILDEKVAQVIAAPKSHHSEKPLELHRRIERLYGERPKLELFARQQAEGWTCTGLELTGHDYRDGELT